MKQTIRIMMLLAAMIVTAGQTWADNHGYITYTQGTNDGGKLEFYYYTSCKPNFAISIDATTHKSAALNTLTNHMVYIKALPDAMHTGVGVTFTVKKSVSSDGAQSRSLAPLVDVDITVTADEDYPGIYSFPMPEDGSNVTITATFGTKPTNTSAITYIDADGTSKSKTSGSVYTLDGSETVLGVSGQTTWYFAPAIQIRKGNYLTYADDPSFKGDVHLILGDGTLMIAGNISGTSTDALTIYGQHLPTGTEDDNIGGLSPSPSGNISGFSSVTVNSGTVSANIISAGTVSINGGQVTASESITSSSNPITLGWNSVNNMIMAASFNGDVTIAKRFLANVLDFNITSYDPLSYTITETPHHIVPVATLSSSTDADAIAALARMELKPLNGYTVATDASNSLTFSNKTEPDFSITTGSGDDAVTSNYYIYSANAKVTIGHTGDLVKMSGYYGITDATVTIASDHSFTMPTDDVELIVEDIAVIPGSLTYTGSAQTPDLTFTDASATENTHYTITSVTAKENSHTTNNSQGTAQAVDAGNYTLAITGLGAYIGSADVDFDIDPVSVSSPTITVTGANNSNLAYTGNVLNPVITVKNGTTEIHSSEYRVIIKDAEGAIVYNPANDTNELMHYGTYTIYVSDALAEEGGFNQTGNFTIADANTTFNIGTKTLTVTANANQTKTYGDEDPTLTYTYDGLEAGDQITGALSREEGEDVKTGGYAITVGSLSAGTDYTIDFNSAAFTITKKDLTITAASQTWTYDGDSHDNQTVTVASTTPLVSGDELVASATGTVTDVADTQNGNNPIATGYKVMKGDKDVTGNYTITAVAGTLAITPYSTQITVTITGTNSTFVYDGQEHEVTGYDVEIDNELYTANDFNFSGTAEAKGTDNGYYPMGLAANQFENKNGNFSNVTFSVTDGGLTINPVLFAKGASYTWMTWCDKNEYTVPTGCTAYTISGISGSTVTLSDALTTIPAYTPVLIQREEGDLSANIVAAYKSTGTGTDDIVSYSDNSSSFTFYGNAGSTTYTDDETTPLIYAYGKSTTQQSYVLRSGDFIIVDTNAGIAAHRCWLNVNGGSSARVLSIGDVTAIRPTPNPSLNGGEWYDLQGRRLNSKPSKGLYINNGKKVVVK